MRKEPKEKKAKFNFEEMRAAATSENSETRKNIFIEYFDRFGEFPSYLFDNESGIDSRLSQTIEDLRKDPDIKESLKKGLVLLLDRISSQDVDVRRPA